MKTDEWDTHSLRPYVSEFIKPFKGREPGREYTGEDLALENFALMLWKFQEDHHIDYMSAFIMSENWRVLSHQRLRRMFGDAGPDAEHSRGRLFDQHPGVSIEDLGSLLPRRNIAHLAEPLDNGIEFWEGELDEF